MLNFFKLLNFIAIMVVVSSNFLNSYKDQSIIERFKNWVKEHKIQSKNDDDLFHIFDNWMLNDKYIFETNSKNLSYTLGHNAYSGMNSEEFSEYMGFSYNQELFSNGFGFLRGSTPSFKQDFIMDLNLLPSSIDWRTKGAVTEVKNQGSCGSCYSFSSTGALEGIYSITRGNLLSFSEQQIVDCDNGLKKSHGCNGGMMDQVFQYVKENGGLCTEQDYPYVSGTTQQAGSCQTSCNVVSNSKISKFYDVSANSDNALMTALAQQPVSAAIQADQKSFQMYKSGVFTDSCGTDLDHGILLVGYGTLNGLDYYILKNSWGANSWGDNGYMLLGKGNDPLTNKPYNNGSGQCGVLGMASYPTL